MRQISTDGIVPGMYTARHVFPPGEYRGLPLLAANVLITEAIRDRLIKAKVHTILIEDELSEGIEARPPITDEVRRAALTTVRSTFDYMQGSERVLSRGHLQSVEITMNAIMAEIESRRNLLVCLSDLNMFGGDRMHHAINVCVMGCNIARHFFGTHGWRDYRGQRRDDGVADRLQKLGIGLLLADIGMLSVPEEILAKGSMLTSDERAIVRQHPSLGVEMMEGSDISPLTKVAIGQHHERFDGSGYPKGLAGDDIHDHGAIAAVAEAYMSLCDNAQGDGERFQPHDAWDLIIKASGRLFHPDVVDSFASTVAPYGAGTSVQLADGRFAIVIENNHHEPQRPWIRVTHDRDGLMFPRPFPELDMSADTECRIVAAVDKLPSDNVVASRT